MKKFTVIVMPLALLASAGCSTPGAPAGTQTIDQLPTNTLTLPTGNNVPLYYSADEITQLGNCAIRARQAELIAQEKLDGKSAEQIKSTHAKDKTSTDSPALIEQAFSNIFLSKNDFAIKVFNSCATENNMADERIDRASFCMSSQFMVEYIWNAKQQGSSEKEVRHRLAGSANKAVSLITREIYNHDAETLDDARSRLWNDCIHNFKQQNTH